MSKSKTIELEANGVKRVFDFQHALRILVHEKEMKKVSWQISQKGFEFVNNEIISTKNSGNTKESEK